jgi:hypothetical protein
MERVQACAESSAVGQKDDTSYRFLGDDTPPSETHGVGFGACLTGELA